MKDHAGAYLRKYAQPTVQLAPCLGEYQHGLVIPAYQEGENLLHAVASVPQGRGPVLTVVVLNHREDAPAEAANHTDASLQALRAQYPSALPAPSQVHRLTHPAGELLLIRAVLPAKQGVGMARRLGLDLLLALWHRGQLREPWLQSTDADAILPVDYFENIPHDGPAALLHPFIHNRELSDDILRYELSLRHFVLGLAWAGSPYAFHTIGSTIAAHARAYAQVRGMPLRQAGEDFYFLGKLAKVGGVRVLPGAPISLSGRVSHRVPFGTGRAMLRAHAGEALPCYHPEVFHRLRLTLQALSRCAQEGGTWRGHMRLDEPWMEPVLHLGVEAHLEQLHRQRPLARDRLRAAHEWLDAFATRRLIHAWRDEDLPSLPAEDALARSPFVRPGTRSLEAWRQELCAAEGRLDKERGLPK